MNSPFTELNSAQLEKIINKEWLGIKSIVGIEEEDAVGKGENYGSQMKRLKIKGLQEDGSTVRRSLVMKLDKVFQQGTEGENIFKCEIMMYTEILPKMKIIVDEANASGCKIKLEPLWPICCGVRKYDTIILEDLIESGNSMRNRREPMGVDTAVFVSSQLARFHALSLAAISSKLINPETLHPNLFASNFPMVNNIWAGGIHMLADSLTSDPEWGTYVPKLREVADTCGDRVQEIGVKMKDEFPVVCHGDCWSNNLMFKFSQDSTPISVKFVDYQASHYGSFAWDLTYLMHTSMSAVDRQACYKPLMEKYRASLVETMEALGQDTSNVPHLDSMLATMNQLNLFALVLAFTFFPLTINTMDNAWQVENAKEGTKNTHVPEMFQNPYFKESLKLDLVRFKSQGLL